MADPEPTREPDAPRSEPFFPRGAIAAFVVMLVFYVGLWWALYVIMAARS
jgi:hypothetical protein